MERQSQMEKVKVRQGFGSLSAAFHAPFLSFPVFPFLSFPFFPISRELGSLILIILPLLLFSSILFSFFLSFSIRGLEGEREEEEIKVRLSPFLFSFPFSYPPLSYFLALLDISLMPFGF